MAQELRKTDVLVTLFPLTAVQIVQIGQSLDLEFVLKNVTVVDGKQLPVGRLDHQIGADVKKLFEVCRSSVAVEFLRGDVVVSDYQKSLAFDHNDRGFVVQTFSDQFHLVSWREVPADYPCAISMYVSTPITEPQSPRFRFDPAFYGENYTKQIIERLKK